MADEKEENEDDPAIVICLVLRRLGVALERMIAIASADRILFINIIIIIDISRHGEIKNYNIQRVVLVTSESD